MLKCGGDLGGASPAASGDSADVTVAWLLLLPSLLT
jgi:hypothetical protein